MPRIVLKDLETDKVQTVSESDATIGRDPACGFVIEGPKSRVVSGRHARIFFLDDSWWVEDCSRNGTVLDNERLQAGQRHAVHTGQIIGLGESGPRLRVTVLEARKVAETVMELPDADQALGTEPKGVTAPRKAAGMYTPPAPPPVVEPAYPDNTAAIRRSEAMRAGVRFEEETEPMSPAPDWMVQIVLRAANSNQLFEATAMTVKVGRSPECNIQIPAELGASVSRVHAEIGIQDGGVVIRDAGSRNGTFVNGKRLDSPHQAAKRDLIMLGSGGPSLTIEDLHIVKGDPAVPVADGVQTPMHGVESTPAQPGAVKDPNKPLAEPRTEPAPAEDVESPAIAKGLEDASEGRARRIRVIVWASIAVVLALELIPLIVIRDNLTLNVIMLLAPSDAILNWQAGA